MDMNDNTRQVLLLLGETFRAEILANKAIDEVSERCSYSSTKVFLQKLTATHAANQHELREICKGLYYSPADDIEVPKKFENLMTRKNIPERLLLSWLNECEESLSDLYEQIDPAVLPTSFIAVRERQRAAIRELALITLDTTEIKPEEVAAP
jgi:hypothetical protein